jgi:flavin-dependent dehydrogenase
MRTDVLIFGTGPAGASAAIFLLQQGFSVTVIERAPRPVSTGRGLPVGESLSPAAGLLLRQLGVWEAFCRGSHLPWSGNLSYWGSSKPRYTDFIRHPYGAGWHIDRGWFNWLLLDRAVALGVRVYRVGGVFELQEGDSGWVVRYPAVSSAASSAARFEASFLVDASGAAHVLSRKMRVARIRTHDQLAFTAFFQTDSPADDGQSLIESVAEGWWYTAAIPGDRRVVCYFTSLSDAHVLKPERWMMLLQQTHFIAGRVFASGGSWLAPPRVTDASSSYSERLFGNRWVAVGDAACQYDPLAAHGLMMAMTSGRDAAVAIFDGLGSATGRLAEYASRMEDLFLHAERECRGLYNL